VIVLDEQLSDDDAITTIKRLREDSNTGQIPLLITCDNLERWHSLGLEVDGCYPAQDPPQELLDKLNRMLF
jgi:CheY-like chemotaxis protein